MSDYKKFLIVVLTFIFGISEVNADVVWPSLYIAAGKASIWVIVGGLIVETGFVKYFTKENWGRSILVSVTMNLATGLLGNFLIVFGGLWLDFFLSSVQYVLNIHVGTFHWSHWIPAYILAILINTLIEGGIVKLILWKTQKFKNILPWLFAANAISIIMCAIYVAVVDIKM